MYISDIHDPNSRREGLSYTGPHATDLNEMEKGGKGIWFPRLTLLLVDSLEGLGSRAVSVHSDSFSVL
jgi:hypothetical protein